MVEPRPNVFSVPAGLPFLPSLADAVLSGRLTRARPPAADPLALADTTILLPTRRAVRVFREVLTERLGGDAVILPAIRPIGDIDEEDHLLRASDESAAEQLVLPPAISDLARQLTLTQMTLAWGRTARRQLLALSPTEPLLIPASAADATRLAADLARLLDDLGTAGIGFESIAELVPDDHAGYFQITLDFLKIALEHWPRYLDERGLVDPARRRDTLIRAEARRLERDGARGPVIAAGSTGSIPATAELLSVIARLPNGAVVLPDLDQDLDADGWAAIGDPDAEGAAYGHPQFALKHLIRTIGIIRDAVVPLASAPEPLALRRRLASEALRPPGTTEHWVRFKTAEIDERAIDTALAGVSLLVAHNEQEEAVAIAIAIREALEDGDSTVALVTPDRTIARRVAAELGRWNLAVDDSAGARLDLMPEGVFARLVAEAVVADGDPIQLLALLKHPLAAFGMDRLECRRAARCLELGLFRGRRVNGGVAALAEALDTARQQTEDPGARHLPFARRRLTSSDWSSAARLARRIEAILGPMEAAFRADAELSAADAAQRLLDALRQAAGDNTGRDDLLWAGPGGPALARLIAGVVESADLALRPAEFPPFLAALMQDVMVTRPAGADPRIHIWGTLEARLQSVDRLILAGLDEGIWPAETRTDPWLSRAMRAEIGLAPPERRIGLAAHDSAQGFAAPRVLLTRAEKRGGTPTVASRWLQRLAALVGEPATGLIKGRGDGYVDLARHVDRWEGRLAPVKPPKPRPAVAERPRRLSVTEIETLIRDPYAVYAKHVLGLEQLDPPGRAPDYALRGSLIHEALGEFSEEWSGAFDAAARERLLAIGRKTLAEIEAFPDVHAIWSIRFAAIAGWLIDWEARRSPEIAARHAEIDGVLDIDAPAGVFKLRGRADRIDLRIDGRVEVMDFKTGTPPSAKQVRLGWTPQLAIEAAMIQAGAFGDDFRDRSIAHLGWIGLGQIDRGEPIRSAVEPKRTADEIAAETMDRLAALVAAYDDPERAYGSRERMLFEMRYESPYDHFARVREWALVESEEDMVGWPSQPKP